MRSSAAVRTTDAFHHTIPLQERLIVPLDVPNEAAALEMVNRLGDAVQFYKIGLQFIFAGGLQFVPRLRDMGKKVFLDAKLNDIEQTVSSAIESIAKLDVSFVTVHGQNGKAIREAVSARGNADLKIFVVTALTSLDQDDMHDLGIVNKTLFEHVLYRAENALTNGADGVIASGLEVEEIKHRWGDKLMVITPGIRSAGVPHDDQKRVTTPRQAISAGADYLVVGRQITGDNDPRAAAQRVLEEMHSAFA